MARAHSRRRFTLSLLLAALLSLACAGCGHDESPRGAATPTAFSRLALHLADGAAPAPDTAVVAAFDVLDGSDDWVIETPERAIAHLPGLSPRDDASRVLALKAARTDELVRVIRRGAFDASTFNELRVPIMIAGHGAVRIEFHRDGKTVAQTDATLLHSGPELVPIRVAIPLEVRAAGPFDAVALRLDGDARTYSLRRFELRRAPPAALLPDPARDPELVFVDGEARRGTGLCAGRALEARLAVPADGWLSWTCAEPPAVRRLGQRVTLEVSVAAAGASAGAPLVQRIEFERDIDEPSRWHAGHLSLAALAGRDAVVTFRASADDGGEAGCVVAEASLCRADGRGAQGRRPDVLLITSDTHRGDHLGAAQSGVVLDTPTLDALAARGVLFTDAFSPANVTNPSHMALMTGTHPRDVGILENVTALSDAAPTLAEAFRDAGYATWAVMSTEHLGPRGSGLGQGFDRASWPPYVSRRSGESVDVVERWLPEQDGRPLFVWLHVFDAHWKYEPPPGFDRRYYPRDKDPNDPSLPPLALEAGVLPPDMANLRDLEFPRAQYRAEISSLDHELSRLLEHSPLRDALTVFVGDHGESLGQHGIWFNHDGLYPDTLHIPLILALPPDAASSTASASDAPASAPGALPVRGSRVTLPVTHLDVGRTLLDLAGLRDTPFPGRELPLQDGHATESPPRFALAAGGLCASVTWRGQHLILTLAGYRTPRMDHAMEKHQVELYDLRADPGCEHDLVATQPEVARTLRARLIEWLGAAPDLGWISDAARSGTDDEGLAQLGYTGPAATAHARALWADDDCAWCKRMK
jgi:arylsulfatase A-like enzyme